MTPNVWPLYAHLSYRLLRLQMCRQLTCCFIAWNDVCSFSRLWAHIVHICRSRKRRCGGDVGGDIMALSSSTQLCQFARSSRSISSSATYILSAQSTRIMAIDYELSTSRIGAKRWWRALCRWCHWTGSSISSSSSSSLFLLLFFFLDRVLLCLCYRRRRRRRCLCAHWSVCVCSPPTNVMSLQL